LNTDQGEVELLSEFDGVVAVLELLVRVGRIPVDSLLIDDSRLNLVEELKEDNSASEVFIKIVDEGINTKGVHPVSVSLLFSGFLNSFEFNRLKCGPGVEQVGNEGQVQLLVSLANILGGDEFAAVKLVGILKDHLGSLCQILLVKGIFVTMLWGNLSKKDSVVLRVLDVASKVLDSSLGSSVLEMIVEPSEKDLVNWELQEVLNGFTIFQKPVELWMVDKIDLGEETNPNDLPNETKDKMGLSLDQILVTNVDDVATNSLGGVDCQCLIFNDSERIQIGLVQDTLINSIRDSIVNQFANNESVLDRGEKGHVFLVNGKAATNVLVLLEGIVNVVSKGDFLLITE
jgi:hypothetical protein